MEELGNFKVIFYIALAILYFIFSGKKKSQPPKTASSQDDYSKPLPTSTTPGIPKPSSEYKPKPLVNNPGKTIYYDNEGKQEKTYTLEDVLTQFGNAKVEPTKNKVPQFSKDSLENTNVKLVDYDEDLKDEELKVTEGGSGSSPVFQQDEHYVNKQGPNKYAEMLKDPEGAKTAFIAGEIFTRRVY